MTQETPEIPPSTTRAARTVVPTSVRSWLNDTATVAAIGLVMGFFGPFGTYTDYGRLTSIALWLSLIVGGWLITIACVALVDRLIPVEWSQSSMLAISMPPATLLITGLVRGVFWGIGGDANLASLPLMVFVVTLTVTAIVWLVKTKTQPQVAIVDAGSNANANGPPPILSRLPIKLRSGALYALSAEGHYVRVCTDVGDELILFRLVDAIAETAGAVGAQVHRSHWVAASAIDTHRRAATGKVVLKLKNGREIPVSRAYIKDVRALGWLN